MFKSINLLRIIYFFQKYFSAKLHDFFYKIITTLKDMKKKESTRRNGLRAERQSRSISTRVINVHFWTNTLGKHMNSLICTSYELDSITAVLLQ